MLNYYVISDTLNKFYKILYVNEVLSVIIHEIVRVFLLRP